MAIQMLLKKVLIFCASFFSIIMITHMCVSHAILCLFASKTDELLIAFSFILHFNNAAPTTAADIYWKSFMPVRKFLTLAHVCAFWKVNSAICYFWMYKHLDRLVFEQAFRTLFGLSSHVTTSQKCFLSCWYTFLFAFQKFNIFRCLKRTF